MPGPRLLQLKPIRQKAGGVWLEKEAHLNCCQASGGYKISKRGCIAGTTCACHLLSHQTSSSLQSTSFLFRSCNSFSLVVFKDLSAGGRTDSICASHFKCFRS